MSEKKEKKQKKEKKAEEEVEEETPKASKKASKKGDDGEKEKKSKKVKAEASSDEEEKKEDKKASTKKKGGDDEEKADKKKAKEEGGDAKKKATKSEDSDNKKKKKEEHDSDKEDNKKEKEEKPEEGKKKKKKDEEDKKDTKKEKEASSEEEKPAKSDAKKTPRKKGDEEEDGGDKKKGEDKKTPRDKKEEGGKKSPKGKTPRADDKEKEKEDAPKRTVLRDGQLYLVVSEARELAAKNMFKKGSDPYVEIYLDDGKSKAKDTVVYKSKVLKKELDPNWNESSKIFPIRQKHKSVKIVLKSAGLIDSFLGQVVLPLPDINDGVPLDRWFSLEGRKKKEKVKGEVHIQVLFLDADDSMMGEEFAYPLQCFIKKRKVDVVATLVNKQKVDVEKADLEGYKPLHVAALNNLPDVVSILIDAGAKINAKGGKKKSSPLHSACSASTASAVILLEKGAKVDVEDDEGNKPLHIAALNDQPKSISSLLEHGAPISDKNNEGNTPLHLAIQAKAFLSLKLLVEKGADIYVKNNAGLTCGEAAAELDEETKEIFMKAVGVEDYQEIALLQTWKHRTRFEATGLNYEWQKSPQFAITAKSKVKCRFFVHHIGCPDNHNLGYCVVKGKSLKYKEPSLSELLGHGGADAYEAEIDPEFPTIVVPYAKSQEQPEKISLLVFTQDKEELQITPLDDWQYVQTVKGQWKGKMAGGCQSEQNRKTWHKNPFFSLHIPEKGDVDLCIVLQQKKNAMESIIPYQILPYDFYIGFYLYDADVEDLKGQTTKWKNAMEVLQHFTLDGTKLRQYTIIPTTFNAKEETSFTLSVFSNEKRVTLKAFEA